MHEGTLDPLSYGCLTVQDAYYCYHAQNTLRSALERVDRDAHPGLSDLIKSKADSYDNYNRTFLEDWHIRNTDSVIPTSTMRRYVEHEQRVAREEDPIYALVVYLPCYHLWPWFARRLMMSPRYNPGVYRGWIEGIYQGESESFGGAWVMGNFIEQWKDAGNHFDEDRAFDIYRTSMEFELTLFSEAAT
jgi:thiaminase/transcriptional activator TenA